MAYSAPPVKASGDTFDLTAYNIFRNNWLASQLAAYATKGNLFPATGVNAGAILAVGADDATLVAASGEATGLVWQNQPAARVYNSGNIDPAVQTWVSLTFDTEQFDPEAMHSTVSDTSRLTVPSGGAGLYLLGANAVFDFGVDDPRHLPGLRLLLNGATVMAQTQFVTRKNVSAALTLSTLYSLAVADYVEVQAYVYYDRNILAAGNYSPMLWAVWQRRA